MHTRIRTKSFLDFAKVTSTMYKMIVQNFILNVFLIAFVTRAGAGKNNEVIYRSVLKVSSCLYFEKHLRDFLPNHSASLEQCFNCTLAITGEPCFDSVTIEF